jgi:hypothetical protein
MPAPAAGPVPGHGADLSPGPGAALCPARRREQVSGLDSARSRGRRGERFRGSGAERSRGRHAERSSGHAAARLRGRGGAPARARAGARLLGRAGARLLGRGGARRWGRGGAPARGRDDRLGRARVPGLAPPVPVQAAAPARRAARRVPVARAAGSQADRGRRDDCLHLVCRSGGEVPTRIGRRWSQPCRAAPPPQSARPRVPRSTRGEGRRCRSVRRLYGCSRSAPTIRPCRRSEPLHPPPRPRMRPCCRRCRCPGAGRRRRGRPRSDTA